jgi:cytochrome c biogenesis factor
VPLLGHVALWLALLAALWAAGVGLAATAARRPDLAASAGRAGTAFAVALIVAVGCLLTALLRQDFHVAYVAAYTDRALPVLYRWGAWYAGPEGRLLCWTALVAVGGTLARRGDRPAAGAVLAGIGAVAVGVLVIAENPFAHLPYTPIDGRGLAAELQDPALLLFPPLLYAGFAVTLVPFAAAIAAVPRAGRGLATGTWPLVAWTALALAITLGLWWAYRRSGWNADWIQDPVRNQALPAWLLMGAALHARDARVSLAVSLAAGVLAVWGMFVRGSFAVELGAVAIAAVALIATVVTAPSALTRPRLAAYVGALLVGVGLAAQAFGTRVERHVAPGQSVTLEARVGNDVTVTYLAASRYPVANSIVSRALLEVRRGDRVIGRLGPEQRQMIDIFGNDSFSPVGRASVLHRVSGDIYATLLGVSGANDTAVVRLAINPLVPWIWIGCALVVLAGVTALVTRDGRLPRR